MALGTTNISLSSINREFERTGTQQITMSDTRLKAMAAAGASTNITFSGMQNKAGMCNLTISTAQSVQYNVAAQAASAGYNRTYQKINVVVNSGITVYGGQNANYPAAILFNGLWMGGANNQPYGIQLTNNGTIVGQGGAGAQGAYSYSIAGGGDFGGPGASGSPSIRAEGCTVTVINNGSMVGASAGGAGGQGSGGFSSGPWNSGGGGGGGAPHGAGGAGGAVQAGGGTGASGGTATYSNGGAGGSPALSGAGAGYAGGNFGALSGGGIPLATYIANLNAMTRCDGYAQTPAPCVSSNGISPGAIVWQVTGTRIGVIS